MVRQRYAWRSRLSVDRAWRQYLTLPPPTTWQGKHPLWREDLLDAHDTQSQRSTVPFSEERKEWQRQHLARVHKERAKKRKRQRGREMK
jgi:hypothetical protein